MPVKAEYAREPHTKISLFLDYCCLSRSLPGNQRLKDFISTQSLCLFFLNGPDDVEAAGPAVTAPPILGIYSVLTKVLAGKENKNFNPLFKKEKPELERCDFLW